jgi:hypothetical protein
MRDEVISVATLTTLGAISLLGQRRGEQSAREAARGLAIHRAAHFRGGQRDMMRPLPGEAVTIDFPFPTRHGLQPPGR